jgi:hypothetical protein
MSDALNAIRDSITNIPKIVETYEGYLLDFQKNLIIKGKRLELANYEQATWMSYYDERRVELHAIVRYMEMQVEKIRGKLWRDYTENYSRELSPKDKDQYINNEKAFIDTTSLFLEIRELYEKFESVVESFKARGYALNNITRIRIADMGDYVV